MMQNRSTRSGGGDGGTRLNAEDLKPRGNDHSGDHDVFGILDGIESQFDRLRTIRHEHVDALRTLTERSLKLQEQEQAFEESRRRLDQDQADWEQSRETEARAIEEVRTCLEADRNAHVRRVEEDKKTIDRDRESLESDQQRLRRDLEASRLRTESRSLELEEQKQLLDRQAASLTAQAAGIEEARKALHEKEEAVEAAHVESIEALKCAHFTIAERGRKVRRLESLLPRIRKVRNQSRRRCDGLASANRFYRKQARDLELRIEQQDSRLDEAGRRMRSFMDHLREQADVVEQGHASLALADELKSRVQELESDNKSLEEEADRIRHELEKAEGRIESGAAEADPALADHREHLTEIARHLHRRRERLSRLKKALRTRTIDHPSREQETKMVEQRMRQSELVEQRQRELDDVRCMLATSEKKMIRRWAAPRAIVITGWSLAMMAMIAVGSWLMADHLRPPLRNAAVSLAPQIIGDGVFDEKDSASWIQMHEVQLKSDQFIRDIAQRAASRHLDPWNSYSAVHDVITSRLSIDDAIPGTLVLTLPSEDGERAMRFLDILASSMAVGSQRTISARPGGHVSRVLDQRTVDGVTRHASLEPGTLRDDRLVTASLLFGGGVVISFMLIGIVYSRLLRAKRIFEEAHSTDMDVPVIQARPI